MQIIKSKETMTARERVRKTFALEKTDRVTIGYEANPVIHMKTANALGIPDGDNEKVLRALGVDYRAVYALYKGPKLFEDIPDRLRDPVDGYVMRWAANESGGYWDCCDFPLQGAEPEVIAGYPVPGPDDYDYETARWLINSQRDFALYVGNPGVSDVINSIGRIMGMEDILVNLATEDEATLTLLKRRKDLQLGILERILDQNKGEIDFMWIGEDLGTQHAPMISPEIYRKTIKPVHKAFADLAKSYDIPLMIHTCGSSSWAYEDFIEVGIDAVDTLQPEAANMSPRYLKEKFGGRLSFRGCISTAGPLSFGTAEDTRNYVRDTLEIMMDGFGYHFAPTHMIQDNTPVENVIAMYQAVHDFGSYDH